VIFVVNGLCSLSEKGAAHVISKVPWLGVVAAIVGGIVAIGFALSFLPGLIAFVLSALVKCLEVFARAFSRSEPRPIDARPKGYKWGYVFAGGNAVFGIVFAAAVAAFGSRFATNDIPSDNALLSILLAGVMALLAAVTISLSICGFVRRFSFCYLVIAVGIIAGMGLTTFEAIIEAVQGKWPEFVRTLFGLPWSIAWLAYFGNRRHQFGYLKDDYFVQTEERLDAVQD